MRQIVLDTETTGLDPKSGDRLVEIGCVELVNQFPTGRTFHVYVNPDRSMPREAFEVHGLSDAFLADKPRFEDVAAARSRIAAAKARLELATAALKQAALTVVLTPFKDGSAAELADALLPIAPFTETGASLTAC